MSAGPHDAPDEALERTIGILLRVGVSVATAVAVAGGLVFLARHGQEPAHYGVFHGEPADLRALGGVLSGIAMIKGRSIIQLGLLLLIATPVARVALTLAAFARARDANYVVITGLVLALLLFSLCSVA
jgi:uncharacterized membrane protein